MASTVYRRQSMAQLYEKLRAQDDDDDMAWLAQFSPDDKSDEPYAPRPAALSAISSNSPASSCSSGSSFSDPVFDNDSSDDHFDSDSDSDVDPEPLSLDLPYTGFDPSPCSPLIFQSHNSTAAMEPTEPTDTPYIPSAQEIPSPQSRSTPSIKYDLSPSPILTPSIPSRRTTRSTRKSPGRHFPPVVLHDYNEDAYSESDGNGSEDEYLPSPTLGSRKRHRSARSASSAAVTSPQKRSAEYTPRKRPRHSPQPRNAQATLDITSPTPAAKNNPWACPYCKWVQRNHRTPDLKRHIRTHTRLQRPAQWVCCGVPVEEAANYNVSADAQPYVWGGETMIGGCRKEFSRRDALKRHLDNDHISCIGNFAAFASICEDDV